MTNEDILLAISQERQHQITKWGIQNHPLIYWRGILMEEVGEAAKDIIEDNSAEAITKEMVQVAAVAVACIDCIQRNEMKNGLEMPKLLASQ